MSTLICPVAARAAKGPNDLAIWSPEKYISYAEWHKGACALTELLSKQGVTSGSRIAFSFPLKPGLLTTLVSLFRIGAVAFPVDRAFPTPYRNDLHRRLGCDLDIATNDEPPKERSDAERAIVPMPAERDPERYTWPLEGPATAVLTSGSSGDPKIALLSLANHLAAARAANGNIPLGPEDTWLLSLPMHHVAGCGILFRCLLAGARIALPGHLPLREAIVQSSATHVSLVARQLAQLMDAGPVPPLKAILLGGSAIPGPLLDRAFDAGLPIHTSYGMTEMATQVTATPPGASREMLDTAGWPLAPGTIRIGAGGRIEVNGPARFLGYWEDGALLEPFDDEGWFTTGDIGYLNDSGCLHVTGRADNMFAAGGENIQPESIERALLRVPGITQAIVVPVPHPEFGATPVAFVECAGILDAGAIRGALSGILPRFMVPQYVLPWPSDVTGESMKINRRALIEEARRQIAGEQRDRSD